MRNSNKGRRFHPQGIDSEDVAKLLAVPSDRAPTGRRNRALLAVLYRTGLRVSEALDLAPDDLDARQLTILVRNGKGGKARVVIADARTFELVDRWLAVRPDSDFLFCTLKGGRVSSSYVRDVCKRIQKKAGVGGRVHPHAFRHTHANELDEAGTPLRVIRDQLGHARASTTDAYLDITNVARRQRLLAGREWA